MRFTIPGRDHDLHRAGIRRDRLTRGEAWRIILTADRLHGIGLSKHPRSVHRERVRFGAWEARPRVEVGDLPEWIVADLAPFQAMDRVCQIYAETWPALAALAGSGAGTGVGEGPADSGGSQTYKRPLWADSPDLAEETR